MRQLIGASLIVVALLIIVHLRVTNLDVPEGRLLVEHAKIWLLAAICGVTGAWLVRR